MILYKNTNYYVYICDMVNFNRYTMKKHYLFASCLAALALSSCSEDSMIENLASNSETKTTELASRSIPLNDSIIQLNEEDFPDVPQITPLSYGELNTMLSQLNEVPIQIQSTQYNMGKNTLEFVEPGKELKFSSFSKGNNKQMFYIKILPPSSGINYLLYTWNDDPNGDRYPIGVGSYASNPDKYVLYAKKDNTGILFGFSWDFMYSNSENGIVIENQDLLGQGSGGPMDIYHYSITASSGLISIDRTHKGASQEFVIIPDYTYEIIDLEFYYDEAQITNSTDYMMKEETITNNGSTEMTKKLTVSETKTEECTFTEQKGLSLTRSGSQQIGIAVAEIVNIGGSASIQQGETQTVTYANRTSIQRTITDEINYTVPAHTRTKVKYMMTRCILSVPYKITCRDKEGKNLTLDVRGVWNGVDYMRSDLIKEDTPLSNPSNVKVTKIKLSDK